MRKIHLGHECDKLPLQAERILAEEVLLSEMHLELLVVGIEVISSLWNPLAQKAREMLSPQMIPSIAVLIESRLAEHTLRMALERPFRISLLHVRCQL